MLTDKQYKRWVDQVALTSAHAAAIKALRSDGPVRKLGASRSVSGEFPSKKMGHQVRFESRTGEFPACILFEHEPKVIEYWDQPAHLLITYSLPGGKPAAHTHVPDYLVLRDDGAAFIEVKHRTQLEESLVRTPGRFTEVNRKWHCPSGEAETLARFGSRYEVLVADDLPTVLVRNLIFLKNHAFRPN